MDLVDLSTVKGSTENFEVFIDQLCQRLGVEYGSYATMNPVTGAVQGYATYRRDWKEHYMRGNLHLVDPTLHKSALSIAPVDWSRFDRDAKFHAVFRSAHDFGIAPQGITVPIRGPYGDRGLLSVTAAMPEGDWRRMTRQIVQPAARRRTHNSGSSPAMRFGRKPPAALNASTRIMQMPPQ